VFLRFGSADRASPGDRFRPNIAPFSRDVAPTHSTKNDLRPQEIEELQELGQQEL
jgi:hypothetical protein